MRHILITGIQRSGTTFAAKILSYSPEVLYLPEPFNPNYGLKGTDCHFPYINYENDQDYYSLFLNDLFSFRARYKKTYFRDNLPKKIGKYFLGSRADLRYRVAKLQKRIIRDYNRRFLIKDPDAAYLSEHMSLNHNCQVLILVRHPGAIMASFRRLGWNNFDPKFLLQKKDLMRYHLVEFEPYLKNESKTLSEQVGLLWLCIYKVLKTFNERNENWLTILHEDLCLHPMEGFKRIFEWADLTFSDKVRKEIFKRTRSGNRIEARNNQPEDLTRDSRRLVAYWKDSVSVEERNILREVTQPISCHYYDENSWKG